jgi:integrase
MKEKPDELIDIPDDQDIFDHYIKEQLIDLEPNTIDNYKTAIQHCRDFLEKEDISIDDNEFSKTEATEFIDYLLSQDSLNKNSAIRYASKVKTVFSFYNNAGYFEWNPLIMELEKYSKEPQESARREVSLEELRHHITEIDDPTLLVAVVILLKSGARRSEVINLDMRDIHIDHPIQETISEPRKDIRQKPDTIYIPSSIGEDSSYNGEIRKGGNKRKNDTMIPIDPELKKLLIWYIALSPPAKSEANPLLRNLANNTGTRPAPSTLWYKITDWGKEIGIHQGEGGLNVDVHWFRHFFTTHMTRRISPSDLNNYERPRKYVKGLRGDSGEDVIDMYIHDWGNNDWKRTAYLDNIYTVLDYY